MSNQSKLSVSEVQAGYKSASIAIRRVFARYARALTDEASEDLQQESLVRALGAYNAEAGAFGALVYRTAVNVATDHLRGRAKAGGSKECAINESSDDDGNTTSVIDTLVSHEPTPLAALLHAERQTHVERAVRQLAPSQRNALSVSLADERSMTGAERKALCTGLATIGEIVMAKRRAAA